MRKIILSFILSLIIFLSLTETIKAQPALPPYEKQVSSAFYNNIVTLDSLFFDAYNHCQLNVMDSLLSDDLEFYHDKGGFSDSKKQTLEATRKNICGKVTRELLKGSIEVYEIKDYGAIQIGFHGFHNNQEKAPAQTHFSKFVHIWRKIGNKWQLTRIISLH